MNGHGHLSEDVLLDALYGIAGVEAEAHAGACPECAGRLSELRQRAKAAAASEISDEFLAAQRRKIYQRIERPARGLWWWAPVVAVAGALVVGVFVYRPHRDVKPVASAEVSDAQLFNDVYSLERTPEPSAAAPVHALFEEQAQ
ncbi:MAG: hypothetical protein LUO89_08055 [Methanothrix sp.]|nr:hypothetical protein [Methanothrix sp.]